MVKPLFIEDDDVLSSPGLVKTPWDPALRHRRNGLYAHATVSEVLSGGRSGPLASFKSKVHE